METVNDLESGPLQLVLEPRPSRKCGRRGRRATVRKGDCDNHNPLSHEDKKL